MYYAKLLLPFCALLCASMLPAQDARIEWRVEVSDTVVAPGQTFEIALVLENAQNVRFPEPDFESLGLRVLGTSQSSSMSISEGAVKSTTSAIYTVRAVKPGLISIPPLHLHFKGVDYVTQNATILVSDDAALEEETPLGKPSPETAPPPPPSKPKKRLNTIRI